MRSIYLIARQPKKGMITDMNQHPTEREARRNIQRYLRQLSYFEPALPAPPIDGVEGGDTTAAIKAFQKLEGLPETGTVDDTTFDLLFESYISSLEEHSLPESISPFPGTPEGYTLTPGNSTPIVRLVQLMLREISAIYDMSANVIESGVYDEATSEAVGDLQYRNLLPVTGNMDKSTWNALARAYGLYLLYIEP